MSVPGSNLLNKAFGAIAKQTVAYYKYAGRVENDAGNLISMYSAPIDVKGSLQPLPQSKYAFMGLDLKKSYANFYCPSELLSLQRDVSGDMFQFGSKVYQVESLTDWFLQDGWVDAFCVVVDEAAPGSDTYVVDPDDVYIIEPEGDTL